MRLFIALIGLTFFMSALSTKVSANEKNLTIDLSIECGNDRNFPDMGKGFSWRRKLNVVDGRGVLSFTNKHHLGGTNNQSFEIFFSKDGNVVINGRGSRSDVAPYEWSYYFNGTFDINSNQADLKGVERGRSATFKESRDNLQNPIMKWETTKNCIARLIVNENLTFSSIFANQ